MAPFLYHRQTVPQEHTVLLELAFAMHVLWGHILVLQHHFVHLVQQGTRVTIPVNHHKHVPLQNIGTMVERSHDVLPVQRATVVEMSPSLLFHVHLGIIPFKEMHLVQNVKLDRLVLILLRHLNTVLLALTAKRVQHLAKIVLLATAAHLPALQLHFVQQEASL